MNKKTITADDILSLDEYEKVRAESRRRITERKKNRRVCVGPDMTFYFECWDTMWHQIQEMLRIEKGGQEQLEDELSAYNPLVPQGNELVATMMVEIDDERRRDRVLRGLGGIEDAISIQVDGMTVKADPEREVERTTDDGKSSSIHFLHFRFTPDQVAAFAKDGATVMLAVEHENYGHMAKLPDAVRKELAGDFDTA